MTAPLDMEDARREVAGMLFDDAPGSQLAAALLDRVEDLNTVNILVRGELDLLRDKFVNAGVEIERLTSERDEALAALRELLACRDVKPNTATACNRRADAWEMARRVVGPAAQKPEGGEG